MKGVQQDLCIVNLHVSRHHSGRSCACRLTMVASTLAARGAYLRCRRNVARQLEHKSSNQREFGCRVLDSSLPCINHTLWTALEGYTEDRYQAGGVQVMSMDPRHEFAGLKI